MDIEKSKFKEIDKLEVFCDYDYNVGTAKFDNLRLVRNSIETDLTEEDFNSYDTETENEDVGGGAIDNPSNETEKHRGRFSVLTNEKNYAILVLVMIYAKTSEKKK